MTKAQDNVINYINKITKNDPIIKEIKNNRRRKMSNFKVYLMQTQTARGCVDVKAYNAHDAIELVKQMIDDYSIDEKIKHKNIVDYDTWKIDDLEAGE